VEVEVAQKNILELQENKKEKSVP